MPRGCVVATFPEGDFVTGIDTPQGLLEAMQQLRSDVLANTEEIFGAWQPAITRPGFPHQRATSPVISPCGDTSYPASSSR